MLGCISWESAVRAYRQWRKWRLRRVPGSAGVINQHQLRREPRPPSWHWLAGYDSNMRPFLFSIAILAGSATLVFLVFAAIQVAIQVASLLPPRSLIGYFVVALLNFLSTQVIATTAALVITIVAGRWLWIKKNVHPLYFALGIVLSVVVAFILYMVVFIFACC